MLIYLDFDGVLHPDAVYSMGESLDLRAPGQLFMHAHILEAALESYPQAKIVLSTSWLRVLGYERTIGRMPERLAKLVVGVTFDESIHEIDGVEIYPYVTRYQQISDHIRRYDIKKWIAIDDLHSGAELEDWPESQLWRLVLIEQSKGLGCEEAQADLRSKLLMICD